MDVLNVYELPFLNALQQIHNPVLDWIMMAFSFICEHGEIWILLGIIMLFFRKTRKGGIVMLSALAFSFLVNNIALKNMFARTRPFDMPQALVTRADLIAMGAKVPGDMSFPSGHAAASFSSATALLWFDKKHFGFAAIAVAVIIAFSRLYLYIHYPTDILGGIIGGVGAALIVIGVTKIITKKIDERKAKA